MASASTQKQERLIQSANGLSAEKLAGMSKKTLDSIMAIDPETLGALAGQGRALKARIKKLREKQAQEKKKAQPAS